MPDNLGVGKPETPMSDEQLVVRLRALAATVVFNAATFKMAREAMEQSAQRIDDYAEAHASKQTLVREMDVAMNADKAAKQASLCDLVGQVSSLAQRERNASELLRRILARIASNSARRYGIFLWAVVSDYFAMGSTRSKELCRAHGLDPDVQVRRILR